MRIYWVNPVTKEFAGGSDANESPLEPGVFAIPADAVTVEPPAPSEKQAAVYLEGGWSLTPDHRGETWFAGFGQPVLVDKLGDPMSIGLTPDEPDAPAPEPVDPGVTPPSLVASALSIEVADGDIVSVEGIYGFAGAIYLGLGQYMLLFLNSQPDTAYFAIINGGAPCMALAEKDVDYLIIQATDAAGGSPVDPAQFNVQVFRV